VPAAVVAPDVELVRVPELRRVAICWIRGRSAATRRSVNAWEMSRRSRVWPGPG
jgi:hypothetical protein